MTKSRIIYLAIGLAMALAFFASCSGSEKRYVRKDASTPEGQADLTAMRKALAVMKAKGCEDPTSWYYQSAMHWIPDTIRKNALCEAYHNPSDLKDGWDNCTHSPTGKEKLHFLVWHRMYIWHFEKIVRKLSGKRDFALPYWNYASADGRHDYRMPREFRTKGSLYTSCRFDSLNAGYPISGEGRRALDLRKLMSYKDYRDFCYSINAAPHGSMHDYIGSGNDTSSVPRYDNPITGTKTGTGLMGWVPTAAFDPIFWLHHSNIDRIWQQWTNSSNGQNVELEDLKSVYWPYVFFDENGKKVVYSIEDVISVVYQMDYDFDDTKLKEKVGALRMVRASKQRLIAQAGRSDVSGRVTDIKTKALLAASEGAHGGCEVEVKVSFKTRPKGVYELYMNHRGSNFSPSHQSFVGYMTFFGQDHGKPGCDGSCCREVKDGRQWTTFYFRVPERSRYDFKIYKHNGVHTGDVRIESVRLSN